MKDHIVVTRQYEWMDGTRIDATFTVDGIEYDECDAENEIRPMCELIDDVRAHQDYGSTGASFMCFSDPATESELDSFVRTGHPYGPPW